MLNVLLIDDRRAFAEALAYVIDAQPDLCCVGIVDHVDEALGRLATQPVDVAVLTTEHGDGFAPEAIGRLRDGREIGVVVLAEEISARLVFDLVEAGRTSLLSKRSSAEQVLTSIRATRAGQHLVDGATVQLLLDITSTDGRSSRRTADGVAVPAVAPSPAASGISPEVLLTAREMDVLTLLGDGLDPKQIAARLCISVHTTRGHLKNIMMKLGAHSQVQAVVIAARAGLLPELARDGDAT